MDIDKLKNVPTNLSNLKCKIDKLYVDELVLAPVDLSKLSDVVKTYVVKKDVYNAKIKNIDNTIPDITNLTPNTTLNSKIKEVKNEILSISNLATTAAFNAKANEVKNKKANITNLASTTAALTGVENKIPDHHKYITTPEFNKLTTKKFAARLTQANLGSKKYIANFVKKTDFDHELNNLNKNIT